MPIPSQTLRKGSSGGDVATLQGLLNTHIPSPYGYMLAIDGDFGPATWGAVVFFQGLHLLEPDGIVGSKTWGVFRELEGETGANPGGGSTIGDLYPGTPPPVGGPGNGSPGSGNPGNGNPGSGNPGPGNPSGSPDNNNPVPDGPSRGTMRLRRTGELGHQGGFLGEVTINGKKWATIERGGNYTSVRQGTYYLTMDMKGGDYPRPGIRFDEHPAISAILWHDAAADSSLYLEGCISPGFLRSDGRGIVDAKEAMAEVFLALGGYTKGAKVTCIVENNAPGKSGEKDSWIRQRAHDKGLPYP